MSIASGCTVLIIDQRPDYLRGSRCSILTMPLAGTILLELVRDELSGCAPHCQPCLLPRFAIDAQYVEAVRDVIPEARICTPDDLHDVLAELEPSDRILVLDPSHLPVDRLRLDEFARSPRDDRGALHLVPLAATAGRAGERVHTDARNRVRRIQRYYGGITDVQASGTVASWLPVSALRSGHDLSRVAPSELRASLMLRGIPSRDVTMTCPALDLNNEAHVLKLNARLMRQFKSPDRSNGARAGCAHGARRHPRAVVHASARLFAPVHLGDACRIDAGAVIVGPAVIGRGVHVGEGAVVVNAIIHDDVELAPGSMHCDRVVTRADAGPVRLNGRNGASVAAVSAAAAEPLDSDTRAGDAPAKAHGGLPQGAKRALDVSLSLIGLVILSPIMLITAILVKLTSRGPVLFGHLREGRGGREFRCWKFRTMVADAHAQQRALYKKNHVDGPQFKMDDDPRITRLGGFLRASNIDELPQLFNVILGHMSLIGPRPSPFRENQICVPWRKARLSVRPGITGLWQVCRHERSAGDFHQWIYFDMLYVRAWTFWMDLRILAATLLTLGGRFSVPVRWIVRDARMTSIDAGASLDHLDIVGDSARAEWNNLWAPASVKRLADDGRDDPADAPRRVRSGVGDDPVESEAALDFEDVTARSHVAKA